MRPRTREVLIALARRYIGRTLPPQKDLADVLGLSQQAVSHALVRLQADGVIHCTTRRRTCGSGLEVIVHSMCDTVSHNNGG